MPGGLGDLGDAGLASGPVVLSLLLGIAAYRLFLASETDGVGVTQDDKDTIMSHPGQVLNEAFAKGAKATADGVSCEENGQLADAHAHYRRAEAIFARGLQIKIPAGPTWDAYRETQRKMGLYNTSVQERLDVLKKKGIGVKPADAAAARDPKRNPLFPSRFWKMSGASEVVPKPEQRTASDGGRGRGSRGGDGPALRSGSDPLGGASTKFTAEEEQQLKAIDEKLWKQIMNEVVQHGAEVKWDSIIGLQKAKEALHEIVILPALNPELFTGLRAPARGLLLFGPPGNGKTMLAKALAHETDCRFFNISASTLTSKWMGEGEKLVKALFTIARAAQPSIIFIDEVDSILTKRSEGEHEASRRLKTELLIQFDGVTGATATRLLVMGATNLPWEIDEAGLRRFTKRIYIRMPSGPDRGELLKVLLKGSQYSLSSSDFNEICRKTKNYSNSDLNALARDAALGPIRALGTNVHGVDPKSVRPINKSDFLVALTNIRPSTTPDSIRQFDEWAAEYGAA
eukprot:m.81943 g.81943  ORF g.81943 m.81943 type:complete len:515 (-) comp9433_c0_seq1:60-1604(-)